jgi:hypothetical protein
LDKYFHKIPSISKFLAKIVYPIGDKIILDPFANRNHGFATHYNDINPNNYGSNLDALDFLKQFESSSVDGVLFDPPYSLRQLKECYEGLGKALTGYDTTSYFHDVKREIARVVKPGGFVVSFCWNSVGIGKNKGFEIEEILLISHGGLRNDTICTFEIFKQMRLI